MAQVTLENIYKSFPGRKGERNVALPTAEPLLTPVDEATDKSSSEGTNILRRINLTVQDGEFMVLVGPSGCGKSTLLRLIAGLETLTGGKIWVGDALVNDLPPKERDIAMVFKTTHSTPTSRFMTTLPLDCDAQKRKIVKDHLRPKFPVG